MRTVLDLYGSGVVRRALLEAVLVGALCGAVGVHVVLRRLPFFAITVAHATFPGVVLAEILGVSLLGGGLAFAVLLTLAVHVTHAAEHLDTSTSVGVALAGSFGLGVMLQSSQHGFSRDLTAVLVGQVLGVRAGDLLVTAVVGAVVVALLVALHKELVLAAFDPAGARAIGVPRSLDLALLLVVAATVVTTVPAVGTILSVALLAVPPLTARLVTRSVGGAMALAAMLGATAGAIGLTASARWDVAAGGAITLAAAAQFVVVAGARGVWVALRRGRRAPRAGARPAAVPG